MKIIHWNDYRMARYLRYKAWFYPETFPFWEDLCDDMYKDLYYYE